MAGITSYLAKKSLEPPETEETAREGSPGGLQLISAGATLLSHTVFLRIFFNLLLIFGTEIK